MPPDEVSAEELTRLHDILNGRNWPELHRVPPQRGTQELEPVDRQIAADLLKALERIEDNTAGGSNRCCPICGRSLYRSDRLDVLARAEAWAKHRCSRARVTLRRGDEERYPEGFAPKLRFGLIELRAGDDGAFPAY